MNNAEELLTKFKTDKAFWSDFSEFLSLPEEKLSKFLDISLNIKLKNFGNELKIYVPNEKFPAISITGDYCELNCEHCNEKYLKGMKALTSNRDLYKFLKNHAKSEGVGALISGGCLSDGSVPLLKFLETIKRIKIETDLIINMHTGLLDEQTAKQIADAEVDIVSFDINVDQETIQNIYHLDKNKEDYKQAIKILKNYGLNIVPHICIGLYYGEIHKEIKCLKFIKDINLDPSLIVLIALIPPKNSKINFRTPSPSDISKIIALTRIIFPNKEISLGCMRPRGNIRHEIEKKAFKAGITRMEMPSKKTIEWIRDRFPETKFKFFSSCCAIPREYENKAIMDNRKVKKFLKI